MALHLIKLCVGANSVGDLEEWQRDRTAEAVAAGREPVLWHRTRMFPKRRKDILDGGSLYWVIKGAVLVRQQVVDLRATTSEDGIARCDIILCPELQLVHPVPRRPFQGWRYLAADEAPADLKTSDTGFAAMPAKMRAELLAAGLI